MNYEAILVSKGSREFVSLGKFYSVEDAWNRARVLAGAAKTVLEVWRVR